MQLDFSFQQTREDSSQIFTVSTLTRLIRKMLESRVSEIWVEGEISNLRKQASGHFYFTLKDASAQLSCILFASEARSLQEFQFRDGLEVQLFGRLTVYEPRGQYQMVVRFLQPKGLGALQAKFEAVKRKLEAEGLFRLERKRPLPRCPRRIGVVTSPTGAAIRDFLHVLARRHPAAEVILHPVRVQGKGAASEIASAVRHFADPEENGLGSVDVIVLTRGGGSIEDLWAFNEEEVARAIFDSPVPIVSAIGHEIDFTIADFVADVRAPTPSAAAEILVADQEELRARLRHQAARLLRSASGALQLLHARLSFIRRSALFREPLRTLLETRQTLDRLETSAFSSLQKWIKDARTHTAYALAILRSRSPVAALNIATQSLNRQTRRLTEISLLTLQKERNRVNHFHSLLEAFSPQATLLRGFTITTRPDGSLLHASREASECAEILTRFPDGEIRSSPLRSVKS